MLAHWEKIPDYLEIYACCVLCVRVCVVYVLNGIGFGILTVYVVCSLETYQKGLIDVWAFVT